ncbi:MAG: DNA-binding domain-containing protein [Burkholderiales bacterium]
MQSELLARLFRSPLSAEGLDIVEHRIAADDRLDIYRNNAFSNLRGALQAVYPVVNKLVGADFFNHAANEYIGMTPSVSGDLHDYGADFSNFLRLYQPATHLLYLPDVARLEWACHRVFHAADHPGLNLQKLAAVSPQQYDGLKFDLHPATALLQSDFPTLKIWQVNQVAFDGDQHVSLDEGGNRLLVWRDNEYSVRVDSLASGDFVFLLALGEQNTLAAAAEKALSLDAGFDLSASLQHFVAQRILADFAL